MSITVRDLVRGSMRLIGVYSSGETPEAVEEQDALDTLNEMVDVWSAQNLMMYSTKRQVFATMAGTQAYSFGATGTWATTVTNEVSLMSALLSTGVELPMVESTVRDWQQETLKTSSASFPSEYYIERTWPNHTVNVWPVPSENGQVAVYFNESISEFTDLDDEIDLPHGYRQALRYNLALLLAAEYGRPLDPSIVEIARSTKVTIKRANNDLDFMRSDFGVPSTGSGRFDNRTGA